MDAVKKATHIARIKACPYSQLAIIIVVVGHNMHIDSSQLTLFYCLVGLNTLFSGCMKPITIKTHNNFVGRERECQVLQKIAQQNEASIVVVYGRRRVGKTALIEQTLRHRNLLKFEGIEGQPVVRQKENALYQLSKYAKDPLFAKVQIKSWLEFFDILAPFVAQGQWTLYFEEVQWLANYENDFITELKHAWDNCFRHNSQLAIVLCGSSPSFMIRHVLESRALYNRSQHEIQLKEFDLLEARNFLHKRSLREVMDAYLSVGGIPEYLKWVNRESSVMLGLCHNAFVSDGFFVNEHKRIFTSSLAQNKNYKKIIQYLSKKRFATRNEILKHLKTESGGTLSALLLDLEMAGFITRYVPFYLVEKSALARYHISDFYLQFYFKFIQPIEKNIAAGDYNKNPISALPQTSYQTWAGFAFERVCKKFHRVIARILGFDSVKYRVGAFFSRETQKQDAGCQIDLVFDRDDRVYTICEIKYTQGLVGLSVLKEFENKLAIFPNRKKHTIQKVLITTDGADTALTNRVYFDRIITLKDIFNPHYWG
ncbi:MAG: hypothetical protein ACD_62C00171G0002 [uncultured bacterium]|nr:MAG: hypothetical protein ACD_62C00171G0002 [uncultured bacterium]